MAAYVSNKTRELGRIKPHLALQSPAASSVSVHSGTPNSGGGNNDQKRESGHIQPTGPVDKMFVSNQNNASQDTLLSA